MAVRHRTVADKDRELEDLFDLSLDLLCIATVDGYFKRVNLAFERTLGYTREELLSRPFYDFMHPDDAETTREAMAMLARGEELHRFENRYIGSDGAERWLQWNVRPLFRDGLVCAAGRDVTDSRRREEQAALRRVATLVAHRTPPSDVFTAVAGEIRQLLKADAASVSRYDADTAVSRFADGVPGREMPAGSRLVLDGENLAAVVRRTGRPARMDYQGASGPIAELMHEQGIRWAVGVPICVEGRVWGTVAAGWRQKQPVFSDSEQRIEQFTELVAAAIANADSREALQQLADEQAALRRVATLVARGTPPEEVFAAVVAEVGRLLAVASATMSRYELDGAITSVAAWGAAASNFPVASRWSPEGKNLATIVFETGQPARIDDYADTSGPVGVAAREAGLYSAVATPIIVEGRLWGVVIAASTREERLADDTEARLDSFTKLAATAIANAESRAELTASRARIVAAADESRRRIERDLHDGAQQRLVSLALELRATQATLPPGLDQIQGELSHVAEGLVHTQHELQEISRGLHPSILSDSGVGPAVKALARRSPIPVELDVRVPQRLPEQIEVAAYYVVSEMLTNAAKHANASAVHIEVQTAGPVLRVSVRDDGTGGADPSNGSGLVGLRDRVEALGGTISMQSPPGAGTRLTVELPVEAHG
jgi:PAS domain S-box-containing protein